MTKADAVPQGSYKLSPSDSIPSSEHAGPDVGWCVCARVCVWGRLSGGRGGVGTKGRKRPQAGKGQHVAQRRNNTGKKRKNMGLVRKLT